MVASGSKKSLNRILILGVFMALFAATLIIKLFYLQVIKYSYYSAKAKEGHLGYTEIEPRRGEILIKDFHSGEVFRLATSTTFDVLFADPTLIVDGAYIVDKIAPLIFNKRIEREKEEKDISLARHMMPEKPGQEALKTIQPKTDDELFARFKAELLQKISQKTRTEILLLQNPSDELKNSIKRHNLAGIEVKETEIKAHPPQIQNPEHVASVLSPLIGIQEDRLKDLLVGRNRYVVLHSKLPTEISVKLKAEIERDVKKPKNERKFTGIGFQEKTYRFYPEGTLASQVLGFYSPVQESGFYGIEGRFDNQLRGKRGVFRTQLDAAGRQITVGSDIIIQPSIDGDNITLTIDRSVQLEIEKKLSKAVRDLRADSGLILIMEPATGKVLAMAMYPGFDPNEFGKALDKEEINLSEEQIKNMLIEEKNHSYLLLDRNLNYKIEIFKKTLENKKVVYEKYKNFLGAGAYLNKAISEIYEPGSTFKVIAMSTALDSSDVTPNTTYNDTGPIKVDEYEIHNATDTYYGITNMKTVLEKSLNTGIAFVARKIGRDLFYRYIKRFGFSERTDIEFDGENDGTVKEGSKWAESELVTYAFGQGIAVTPVQMINAVSALANKGILMQPYIVEQTESGDGIATATEPRIVRKVISEKTANTITAMMVNAVENGVARKAGVKDHYIAGKTGTAQTYKHGKPLTGPGTTIASFIGFAPIDKPRFAVLIKIDRPRVTIWADSTAAPLFSEIAEFLFKYYNIPPDKK